jgi:hypothetical protein
MTTFVEIVLPAGSGVDRDDIEDLLLDELGDAGDVTGAGMGAGSMNVDVEVDGTVGEAEIDRRIRSALEGSGILGWRYRIEGSAWQT